MALINLSGGLKLLAQPPATALPPPPAPAPSAPLSVQQIASLPKLNVIGHVQTIKPAPTAPVIKLGATGTPTLSPAQAQAITAAEQGGNGSAAAYIQAVIAAAQAGGNTATSAAANAELLALADAANITASYVQKWFGTAQADQVRSMYHLTSK